MFENLRTVRYAAKDKVKAEKIPECTSRDKKHLPSPLLDDGGDPIGETCLICGLTRENGKLYYRKPKVVITKVTKK